MKKISKKTVAVLIVVVSLAIVYGAKTIAGISRKNISGGTFTKVKGNDNAPIKITEFIDFQCPACAKGARYLKETIKKYPKMIRLQLKHYPLQMHRHGALSSRYAECAVRQGKFWPFHDLLIARQGNWKRLTDARPAFERIANDLHMDSQQLEACLQDEKITKIIEKNKSEGITLGVRSTPTYFFNGKMVVGKKSLEQEINKYLEENSY